MRLSQENPNPRILIVEGEVIVARELSASLENLGYKIIGLERSAEKGIALCEQELPDLVLSDILLKGRMDGIEAAEIIRARWGIPVVFLTVDADLERLKKAHLIYPFGYLIKPYREQDLKITVEMALYVSEVDAERKKAEESLRSSEEKLSRIFKTIPDPVSIIRLSDGIFLDVNECFIRVTGYPKEDIVGRPYYSGNPDIWINRKDRVRVVTALRETGEVHGIEAIFRGKDEKVIYGLISARTLEINGETCILGIVSDITERRRQEEELRESEERFRLISEAIDEVFWMADSEIEKTFYASPGYEMVWGRSLKSLYENPQSYIDAIHPGDRDRVLVDYEVKKNGNSFDHEYRIIRPDGAIRWIWDRGFPIRDKTGKVTRYVGIARDITDRKRAEEELKKSKDRLRALSAHIQSVREEERADISREIHDDLGQRLTGLKMDLGWILRHLPPDLTELKKKAQEMGQMINQTVGTVRRISTELHPRILDDFGLLAALEWQAKEFTNKTGIACLFRSTGRKLDLKPDLSIAVFRIFQETLTNVVRHSQATKVEASLKKDAKGLVLTIRDNGRGISDEEIAQSNSLGLVGMRERALIFGGTVEIKGRKGKGTTVTLRLPITK